VHDEGWRGEVGYQALASNDEPEKENTMLNAQESRNESGSAINFSRATACFLVLVVTGYAVSTQVESAVDASKGSVAMTAQGVQQDVAPTVYFRRST